MFETTVVVLLASILNGVAVRLTWGRRIHCWEAMLPPVVCLLVCLGCKLVGTRVLTADREFHAAWCDEAVYEEPWTEEYEVEVDDYCTRTDAKGRAERYRCGSHRERRTRHHSPSWTVVASDGNRVGVDSTKLAELRARFGNEASEPGRHAGQVSLGDGNVHRARWDGLEATLMPVTTRHSYVNKVQAAAGSVFHFEAATPDDRHEFGLFDEGEVRDFVALDYLRGDDSPAARRADAKLAATNARLGHEKQVSMHILVFRNRPPEAGPKQEAAWQGGNKNEFIVCVGVDGSGAVGWSHVISWTEQERLKIDVRDFARSMGRWDPEKLIDFLVPAVRRDFARKSFADFDYLAVETPGWAKALAVALSALSVGLIDLAAVRNAWDDGLPEDAED